MKQANKMVIYQVFPRWFGNMKSSLVKNGSKVENGVGKFSDFTPVALSKIKELGTTHIWYTGVIEHATNTDYTAYQIRRDHAAVVKGNAGSPYAIKDYYDIDPDLADNVPDRMKEFESLVRRTHEAGMKVIIDFVPNHVARQYYSDAKMAYVEDLGQKDNTSKAFILIIISIIYRGRLCACNSVLSRKILNIVNFRRKSRGMIASVPVPDKTTGMRRSS